MKAKTKKPNLTDTRRRFALLKNHERETLLDVLAGEIERMLIVHHKLALVHRGLANVTKATQGPHGRPRLFERPMFCPHPERPHYAKGLCNTCWHSKNRQRRARAA